MVVQPSDTNKTPGCSLDPGHPCGFWSWTSTQTLAVVGPRYGHQYQPRPGYVQVAVQVIQICMALVAGWTLDTNMFSGVWPDPGHPHSHQWLLKSWTSINILGAAWSLTQTWPQAAAQARMPSGQQVPTSTHSSSPSLLQIRLLPPQGNHSTSLSLPFLYQILAHHPTGEGAGCLNDIGWPMGGRGGPWICLEYFNISYPLQPMALR